MCTQRMLLRNTCSRSGFQDFYREIFPFQMHLALAEISSDKMKELADTNTRVLKNIGINLDTSARLVVWVPHQLNKSKVDQGNNYLRFVAET